MNTEFRRFSKNSEIIRQNQRRYKQIFAFSQILGLAILICIATWIFKYLGGVALSPPEKLFNFHPLLMIIGLVIFCNAMLIFRSLPNKLKPQLKLAHAALNALVLVLCVLASVSVIVYHQQAKIPHFYSLHSWLGIATWILFVGQFVLGFGTFLYPGASDDFRERVMPLHRFIGGATFVLALATCLTGLNQKAIFSLNGQNSNPNYWELPIPAILVNVSALLLITYVCTVIYLVTKPEFKRDAYPED